MTELKTLKDLIREEDNGPDSYGGMDIVEVKELKQEAIKWIKDLKEKENMAQAFVMSEFFNITEEDLK